MMDVLQVDRAGFIRVGLCSRRSAEWTRGAARSREPSLRETLEPYVSHGHWLDRTRSKSRESAKTAFHAERIR
jgi:hypothetical protein